MPKIIVETLDEVPTSFSEKSYKVDETKTQEFGLPGVENENAGKAVFDARVTRKEPTQKIRMLEYHNDDPDETRGSCKILFES